MEEEKVETITDLIPKKKIAIVGCSDHKDMAPWGNPDFEIWGVNNMFLSITEEKQSNIGAWFEIHLIEKSADGKQWLRRRADNFRGQNVNDYMKMLGILKCPLYMQKKWPEIPNSVEYPLQDVLNYWKTDYINNTISYEILLAGKLIHEGKYAPHLAIYGVDMATTGDTMGNHEYGHQKPSCEWALGLLAGSGITLELPKESDLLKVRWLYGWNEPERNKFEFKMDNLKKALIQRQGEASNKMQLATKQVEQYQGALQALAEMRKIWS